MYLRLPITVLFLAAISMAAELKRGDPLPRLKANDLAGHQTSLPEDATGRVALLALGFTYDSRFAVEAWVKQFRADYGANPEVTFYEIPMIGGFGRLGKWFIDSGMRRGTPKEDHPHVITVYGGTGAWKRAVGFQARDAAYLLLLDRSGKVRWQHSGGYDEAAYQRLTTEMTALLSEPQ